jgi:hypothetical protein
VFDKRITELRRHFGITKLADWQDVEPAWITGQHGVGPRLLNYLRVLLAAHNLALKGDKTPEYWQAHAEEVQIVQPLSDEDEGDDRGVLNSFAILIDTAEQQPFDFLGFLSDADQGNRPLIIPTERECLGRHPNSLGDYSLIGGQGRCHVERKSMEDAQGTILGFESGRRDRFECELQNLAAIEAGCVVVECSLGDLIRYAPDTPRRTAAQNAKTLYRSVIAMQQDYRCQWLFCDDRKHAERTTFRWLSRWFAKEMERKKSEDRERKKAKRSGVGGVSVTSAAGVGSESATVVDLLEQI